jgi:hypothetical protein
VQKIVCVQRIVNDLFLKFHQHNGRYRIILKQHLFLI